MKQSKNRWTIEEDETLKAIMLKNLKEGKTKAASIKIASDELKRTKSAVAFRYYDMQKNENETENSVENEVISNHSDNNTEQKLKSVYFVENTNTPQREVTIESIVEDIQTLLLQSNKNEELKKRNEELEARNKELEDKLSSISTMFDTLKSLNI